MSRRLNWDGSEWLEEGEYAQHPKTKEWYYAIPGTPRGYSGRLGAHTVTEHEDGTITVRPSILLTAGDGKQWHGWLTRGEWEPCCKPGTHHDRRDT